MRPPIPGSAGEIAKPGRGRSCTQSGKSGLVDSVVINFAEQVAFRTARRLKVFLVGEPNKRSGVRTREDAKVEVRLMLLNFCAAVWPRLRSRLALASLAGIRT